MFSVFILFYGFYGFFKFEIFFGGGAVLDISPSIVL